MKVLFLIHVSINSFIQLIPYLPLVSSDNPGAIQAAV